MKLHPILAVWSWLLLTPALGFGATWDQATLPWLKRSFFEGREYFVLRSGRAQMIVQADRADLAPGFLYLLFDAQDNRQSARKERAFNFVGGQGFVNSALEVVLGRFPYTALGHQMRTRWVQLDGIPAVEAQWWAGGLRVTEQLFAAGDAGVFIRRVTLNSADLAGPEAVKLRLSLPPGASTLREGWLTQTTTNYLLAVGLPTGGFPAAQSQPETLELGPLALNPGQSVVVETALVLQMGTNADLAGINLAAAKAQAQAAWSQSSTIATEDATVRGLFDKARFGLTAMVADNGVMNAGIFEYGAQWVRDTSNTLLGLVHAGQFEQARRGLQHVLEHMVTAEGNAMIAGGFDDPDREQFDQMGELMHALKAYRDWTGDESLLREYRAKLIPLIERPLRPEFRDATGMVHNRREFWERTFDDAYELAYQTYVILGLRDAAALAEPMGAGDRAGRWRAEAERIQQAVLEHPTRALVADGRLIKRRNLTGEVVRTIRFPAAAEDVPLKTEQVHLAEPDATLALPIAFGLVPPRSPLALNTLEALERIHDARWFGGGYERYHSSGQCDQPGPWSFATCFILRAQHEARLYDRSRRTLEWLDTACGGRTGAWLEEVPLARSQAPTAGILPWTSGEISLFCVRHWLGVKFEDNHLSIKPSLYPGSGPVAADLRFRSSRLKLKIDGAGPVRSAYVNGRRLKPDRSGTLQLPSDFAGGTVEIRHR